MKSIDKSQALDISKCTNKVSSVVDDIKGLFSDKVIFKGPLKIKHWADKTNKSWFNQYEFEFQNNDFIFVECYNWTDKITSTKGWKDNLRVRIVSKEFLNFLNNE